MANKLSNSHISEKKIDSSPSNPSTKISAKNEKKSSTLLSLENNNVEKGTKSHKTKQCLLNATTDISNGILPTILKPNLGDVWNVYITQMESIDYFYIQNIKHFDYIKTVCSSLEVEDNDSMASRPLPKVGSMVAARYEDGQLYRAKVKRKSDGGLMVCFIDFGNDEVLVTDFKSLPTEFVNIIPMAFKCYFKGLPKTIRTMMLNPYMFDIFKRYFMNTCGMTVSFLSKNDPYAVTVLYKGKNMLDVMYEMMGDGILPGLNDPINDAKRKMLQESSLQEVVICVEPIMSIEHFYVETASSQKVSDTIKNAIAVLKRDPVLHPENGEIVLAKHPKLQILHRARVVFQYEVSGVYNCFLIDLGIFRDCSTFFKPCNVLRTMIPVKIHCFLDGFKKLGDYLLKPLDLSFIDEMKNTVFTDGSTELGVIKYDGSCMVDLVTNGLKISDVLKPRYVKIIKIENFDLIKVRLWMDGTDKITEVLNSRNKYQTVNDPCCYGLYVALCSDQKYKRVKYVGDTKSYFKVTLVDELYKQEIVGTLYQLPKSIENVNMVDFHVSLGFNAQDYCLKKFRDICNNGQTKFMMVIVKHDEINGHRIKLFLESKDVATMCKIQPV